ncbi:MAG TPA: HD domain-containing protein [Nitrososphaerales archaeon]|nr:HD domain-containing protein [Nitrososphaerales archaeon]
MIPSEGEAIALHRKYGSNQTVIEHCRTVAKVAELLVKEFQRRGHAVDVKAVVAAALLHDIGRSRIQTVRHAVEGAGMIEKDGVDRKVVEIVRRHVGAGIAPEEAKRLGLPDLDYIPRTLEERIVCFADKMVGRDEVRPFDEEVHRFTIKSHDVTRLLALKRRLQEELGEDPEKFIFDNIKESHSRAAE